MIGTLLLAMSALVACPAKSQYDSVLAVVTDKFYDRTFRGLDWPIRIASYRERLGCFASASKVAAQANQAISGLHASHTAVYTRADLDYWALKSIFSQRLDAYQVPLSGIWPRRQGTRWYARYVLPGSPAAQAGVQTGDELVSLDGKPFDPLAFKADKPVRLKISVDGRNRRGLQIVAVTQSVQQSFLDAANTDERIVSHAGKRIGYFHLWAGTNKAFLDSLNTALNRFEQERVDAVLLDLRGGYGGASLDYRVHLRDSAYLSSLPNVALIDEGVRSGKEWLAGMLRHERLATLVGSRTAGAFLGGMANNVLGDEYFVYVAGGEFIPPELGPIEGRGIDPDILVPPCLKFCGGADPQLQAALDFIGASRSRLNGLDAYPLSSERNNLGI